MAPSGSLTVSTDSATSTPQKPDGFPVTRQSRPLADHNDVGTQVAYDRPATANGLDAESLFELDPADGSYVWSKSAAIVRIFGFETGTTRTPIADLARFAADAASVREATIEGTRDHYRLEYLARKPDGSVVRVEEFGGWIGVGSARRLIGLIRSIENLTQRVEDLRWLATRDELTGFYNRTSLRRAIDSWLASLHQSRRDAAAGTGTDIATGAYFLVGIDDLGAVNSDFGFEVADQVIVDVAKRLQNQLGGHDLMGRVAGTKFGILVDNADNQSVRELVTRLLNTVRESVIETSRGGIATSISIGTVLLPEFAESSEAVMARAEAALDEAKRLGRANWASYSDNTDHISMRRRNSQLSDVILTALNERRISIGFQPIISDLGKPAGKFECLIRMIDRDGALVPAPEFIPAAERLGLVHLLDRRVLELATNTLSVAPDVELAVNISMETVKDPVWADGYIAHLRANRGVADRVTVELTETQVVDSVEAAIEFVSEIKKLGCWFAIDDFGAGYTSFRNLKALDIDVLKIDGSFVTDVSKSRDNQLFVRTLLDLARNFGMKTVAEWVDSEADAMLLKGLGVDYLQGFLIGKPEIHPSWLPEGAPNKPAIAFARGL